MFSINKQKLALILTNCLLVFNLLQVAAPVRVYAQTPPSESEGESSGIKADCLGEDLSKECKIVERLKVFINVLSGLVGIVVVTMIAIGGIQYSTSRDNPQAVAAAKGRITNAIIALVLYLFMFALLNYLVPGGVL